MMRTAPLLVALVLFGRAFAATPLDDASRPDPMVAALVHRTAAAALQGEVGALDDAAVEARRIDEARVARGLAPTGLTDDVRLLTAALRPTREARRDALDAVLDDDPDPVVERLARHALEHEDDVAAAERLLQDDRHNRRVTVVNEAVRPLGVFSGGAFLAALNPFLVAGSALDSLVTTAVNLYHYNELSPREREALVRYRRQLARDPDATPPPELHDVVRDINARRNTRLCADTIAAAGAALEASDLDRARFYVTSAAALDGCETRVGKPRERLATALVRREAREEAGRWPADEVVPPAVEEDDAYRGVTVAAVLGHPASMMTAAQAFVRRFPESRHRDAATLVVGVARDLAGHRDEAEATLAGIADDDSGAGRVAAAMLQSPRFHRLDGIDSAERRHAREVAEYVLVGGVDGRTALHAASQLGAQGVQAAGSLGVVNVIGMLTRAWTAWRKDPVSNQAIIDEGERFLAREPDAREAPEVHARLATAYERAGAYDRALLHYRASGDADPKRVAALEERIADRLLENAKAGSGEPALLQVVAHYYPATDAAEKAQAELKKLPRAGELPLSRDLLLAHPRALGPSALALDPALFDGDLANGELADAGVTVRPGALLLKLRDPDADEDRIETRPLDDESYERSRAAAEAVLYAAALSAKPDAGEVGRYERYVPFFLTGSVGEEGLSIAPGLKLRPDRSPDRALYE
jgi:tetratricopeptide (TPR) repeat protein